MAVRFTVFLVVLLAGLGLSAYGLFGVEYAVYQKPDPRDAGPELESETCRPVKELEFTDLVSRERVEIDAWGHLIDSMNEAPCFS